MGAKHTEVLRGCGQAFCMQQVCQGTLIFFSDFVFKQISHLKGHGKTSK